MKESVARSAPNTGVYLDQIKLSRPIRVLAVIPGEAEGHGYMFIRRQLRSLERLGVQVRRVFLHSRTSPVELWREWRQLHAEAKAWRPDFVHAGYGTVTSFLPSLLPGVPLLVTFRGSDLNPHPSLRWARKWLGYLLSQWSALRARRIICVSHQLRSRLWCRKSKVTVLLDGVDLNLFSPMPRSRARRVLGWGERDGVVLFCAGTEAVAKGISTVRAAVRLAQQTIHPLSLFILDGNIPPDEIPVYLNAADCLAFASLNEGSPNIVKEALACNLPIVSVDVGDVAERLAGVTPSAIVGRDPEQFAAALIEVLAAGRRSNGREAVSEHSEQAVALQLLALYQDVLETLSGHPSPNVSRQAPTP